MVGLDTIGQANGYPAAVGGAVESDFEGVRAWWQVGGQGHRISVADYFAFRPASGRARSAEPRTCQGCAKRKASGPQSGVERSRLSNTAIPSAAPSTAGRRRPPTGRAPASAIRPAPSPTVPKPTGMPAEGDGP